MQSITLIRPDDWHLHVRDDAALDAVVPHTAARFGRALIMPNLKPPVTTTAQALAYRERILAAARGSRFEPLMSLYLTDNLSPDEIDRARASGHVVACKLYPAGATTNSDAGVTAIDKIYAVLERMEKLGMVRDPEGDFDHPRLAGEPDPAAQAARPGLDELRGAPTLSNSGLDEKSPPVLVGGSFWHPPAAAPEKTSQGEQKGVAGSSWAHQASWAAARWRYGSTRPRSAIL